MKLLNTTKTLNYLQNKRNMLSMIIPLIILLLFIFTPKILIPFSYTILGRLISVLIVIYYTTIDIKIAVVLVFVFVCYYGHKDFEFLHHQTENFLWEMTTNGSVIPYKPPKTEEEDKEEDDEKINDINDINKNNVNPQPPLEYQKI